jgi:ribonucleoside-diphosphate reductase alpha chain
MEWLNKDSRKFLEKDYLLKGVTPEERIKQICNRAEEILQIKGFAEKFYSYVERGWYSFSTPVWTNFGLNRGLPISCFGATIQDDTADILRAAAEIGMLTKYGGGTAAYFGNLRGRGKPIKDNGVSNGAISFLEIFNTLMIVISQGSTRRGSFASYYPITGDDFDEFMEIRSEGHNIQDVSIAVTIPEGFMQKMIDGDKESRRRWVKVIKKRFETGYPYILFEDNVNNNRPQVYKDKGLEIRHSQLCTEILEYTDDSKTFTCCIGSINLLKWDEWKDTDAVETYMYFLDAVLTDFINRAEGIPFLEKAVKFAKEHRSVGLGVLGWHSLLQSKMIPFEGLEAKLLNAQIFKSINEKSLKASQELAKLYGEPDMLKGYGERFTTRIAPAPTTSSSFILGQVSPGIEPLQSNYFLKDLAKGKFSFKNPFLKDLLKSKDQDNSKTWESIMMRGGSVQHLDFLSEREKNVFKTFQEISQLEIIQQAAQRQKYIDQAQSLNLMIHPETSVKDANALLIEAWKLGIKTLYYQRGVNLAQTTARDIMNCVSCES